MCDSSILSLLQHTSHLCHRNINYPLYISQSKLCFLIQTAELCIYDINAYDVIYGHYDYDINQMNREVIY